MSPILPYFLQNACESRDWMESPVGFWSGPLERSLLTCCDLVSSLVRIVGLNSDRPRKKKLMRSLQSSLQQGSQPPSTWVLAETQRKAEGWESCVVGRKGTVAGVSQQKLVAGSREVGILCDREESVFDLLWSVLSWKQGQQLRKVSAINHVLATGG